MTDPLVLAENLTKIYRLYRTPWDRLVEGLTGRRRHRDFHALEGVSFHLTRGEGLAVIGENGAGKSTLLKILAGITHPSSGRVAVQGKVASILELGSGFHPEFTGRENIVLNAAMLGLSDREVEEKTPAIIEFSELGEFIDQPVKTYSTGMSMRLGFAIATQVEPDVLIIDEALSVGDGYFQKKCMDRMVDFLEQGGTLLFCSHAMYYVATFCRRALWLREGRPEALGPAEEVIRRYETFLVAKGKAERGEEAMGAEPPDAEAEPTHRPARLESIRQLGARDNGRLRHRDRWGIEIEWTADSPELTFHLAVGVDRVDDVQVVSFSSRHDGLPAFTGSTRYRVRLEVPELPLLGGTFSLQVYLLDEAALHVYDQRKIRGGLEVESDSYVVGLIETEHRWCAEDAVPSSSNGPSNGDARVEAEARTGGAAE